MLPTLHQLKVFSAVAEHQGFTRAAKILCMTQPAVSIQVKQLEILYGFSLLEVIGKRVYLTDAGKKLHATYQTIAEQLATLEMEISQLQGCLKGKLSITAVSTAKYFIPRLLGEFQRQYPYVEIQLKVTNREETIERLGKNCDDFVIMSQLPEKLSTVAERFLEDVLVIPVPLNHPFAKKKNISLKELEAEPFILREWGSGTRIVMEKLFKQHKLNPKIIMELGSSSAIKQAIIAGFGLSVLSKMSLEQELSLKKLILLDIKELPIRHYWYIVHLKGKKLSPAANDFLLFIKNHINPK